MSFLDDARTRELWEKVKAALAGKQSKLTGTAGQVVGFGADGAAAAQDGWSNPNLLDNWYFADPINQRGETAYASSGYTIDRWRIWDDGATVTVAENGITLAENSRFFQYFEDIDILRGKLVTFSVLTADHELWTDTIQMTAENETLYSPFHPSYELTISNGAQFTGVSILPKTSGKVLVAAKLEFGPRQTLARQDAAGNWILNDAPPNKALELLKCQRYFVRIPYIQNEAIGPCVCNKGWANLTMSIPTPMRGEYPTTTFTCYPTWVQDSLAVPEKPLVVAKGTQVNMGFELEGASVNASLVSSGAAGYIDFDENL